ncbi:class I SAM-dependent methyltransferase [Actinoplanes sp. NPDC051859]|uniref:class I SAM-dependent methyltransferase n=1 Tax=Actinoplanes sp. NPDC051859 TaxID=3363909 RepID=UPI00379B1FC5
MPPASLTPWLTDSSAGAAYPTADALHLRPVALVPEIQLYLAEDPTLLWARLEASAGHRLPAPFWASAWAGGQVLARYVLDNPAIVAGRRVLDIASGSGLVAIAAAQAGAASVTANDIDPYASVAIEANAQANGVRLECVTDDLLDGTGAGADVILAGDGLYEETLATRVLAFLTRAAARGAQVWAGDPGRGHAGGALLERVAVYDQSALGSPEDHQRSESAVYRVRRAAPPDPRRAES